MRTLTIEVDALPKAQAREAVNAQALSASQNPLLWPATAALRASLMGEIDAAADNATVTLSATIDATLLIEAPGPSEPTEEEYEGISEVGEEEE